SLGRSRAPTPVQMGRPHQFFIGGVQQYVAGRHALICGYEAAASLFHQGFELLLKADLLEPVYQRHAGGWAHGTVQQKDAAVQRYNEEADRLLRRRIGHDLWRAWRLVKAIHGAAANLDRLDPVVRGLNRWWLLRYP